MTDRNRSAQQAFDLAQARGQFIRAWDEGRVALLDRWGHPIQKGQYITFRPPATHDPVFEVKACLPSPNPTHPPGTVSLVLEVTMPLLYNVTQRNMIPELSVVGEIKQVEGGETESQITGPVMTTDSPYDNELIKASLEREKTEATAATEEHEGDESSTGSKPS